MSALNAQVKYTARKSTIDLINEFEEWGRSYSNNYRELGSAGGYMKTTNLAGFAGNSWTDKEIHNEEFRLFKQELES